jgi:hypothetical protein
MQRGGGGITPCSKGISFPYTQGGRVGFSLLYFLNNALQAAYDYPDRAKTTWHANHHQLNSQTTEKRYQGYKTLLLCE